MNIAIIFAGGAGSLKKCGFDAVDNESFLYSTVIMANEADGFI